MPLTPSDMFVAATNALIRAALPTPYHHTTEFEYTIDKQVPVSIEVWKRSDSHRYAAPRVVVLNETEIAVIEPIIKRLISECDPQTNRGIYAS